MNNMPKVGSRRWIAWKLVQLAAKLYDAEYTEHIMIHPSVGKSLDITIIGDSYGCGISSIDGPGSSTRYLNVWEYPGVTIEWIEA